MENISKTKKVLKRELEDLKIKFAEQELLETRNGWMCSRIRAERRELEAILNSLPSGVTIIDTDYKIQFQNNWLAERFGDNRDKLCYRAYMGRDLPCLNCPIKRLVEGKGVDRREIKGLDGCYYEITSTWLGDFRGKTCRVEIIEDITARREAQEVVYRSQKKYSELVNNLSVGVYQTTPHPKGKFLEVNSAMVSMFEANSKEELLRHDPSDFYLDHDKRKEFSDKLFKFGFVNNQEFEFITLRGKRFKATLTAIKKQDEEGNVYFVGIIEDITERKRTEALKEELVNVVAHELRTPMVSIRERISQVLEGLLGEINDKQKKYLARCLENIDWLTHITDNLLDSAKIESGKIGLEKDVFNLVDLVKKLVDMFSITAANKGLIVQTRFSQDIIRVCADKDKIMEVIANLLNNAIKFTKEGFIEIAVINKDKSIECSVSDTGKGVAAENIEKLFDKFVQVGYRDGTSPKGAGLGLSITKGIVEAHGGGIYAESKLGQGSKFIFTLPGYTLGVCNGNESDIKNKCIMIIDDNVQLVTSMKRMLKHSGYHNLREAYNGREALDKIKKEIPDALIMDIDMPYLSGYAVVEYLKANTETKDLPIIIMLGEEVDVNRLNKLSGQNVIPVLAKPFYMDDFEKALKSLLEREEV